MLISVSYDVLVSTNADAIFISPHTLPDLIISHHIISDHIFYFTSLTSHPVWFFPIRPLRPDPTRSGHSLCRPLDRPFAVPFRHDILRVRIPHVQISGTAIKTHHIKLHALHCLLCFFSCDDDTTFINTLHATDTTLYISIIKHETSNTSCYSCTSTNINLEDICGTLFSTALW